MEIIELLVTSKSQNYQHHHKYNYIIFLLIFTCGLLFKPVFAEYSWGSHPPSWGKPLNDEQPPVFDTSGTSSNIVSVLVGQTAYLPCRVKHLGDKVVSWIRHRDLHILTSGPHTYTSDARVEVVHPPSSDLWTLRIVSSRASDRGRYECQVNTEPKLMKAVHLDVRAEADMKDSPYTSPKLHMQKPGDDESGETEVRISGPAEQFVQIGSTVTFTCVVRAGIKSGPSSGGLAVAWFHGTRPVSARQPQRAVSVDTERGDAGATSRLTLAHVEQSDAGNYTCVAAATAPEAQAASVALVIVEGEHTEAMQRDMSSSGKDSTRCFTFIGTVIGLIVCIALHRAVWRQ